MRPTKTFQEDRIAKLKSLTELGTGIQGVLLSADELRMFKCKNELELETRLRIAIRTFLTEDLEIVAMCGFGFAPEAKGIAFVGRLQVAANLLKKDVVQAKALWDRAVEKIVKRYYEMTYRMTQFAENAVNPDDVDAYFELLKDLITLDRHEPTA